MIQVLYQGRPLVVDCDAASTTVGELKQQLCELTSLPPAHQKLVLRGAVLQDAALLAPPAAAGAPAAAKELRLMLIGTAGDTVACLRETEQRAAAERAVRASRSSVSIAGQNAKRGQAARSRLALGPVAPGFGAIETLPNLPDRARAAAMLHALASDVGIASVMKARGWRVGVLEEMFPEGQVGVSAVCVMGLNVNAGERIKLRLRTDDLAGFRPPLSVMAVLYHELAHNVHAEHDGSFFALMRDVEREACAARAARAGASSALGGARVVADDDGGGGGVGAFVGGSGRLGGGGTAGEGAAAQAATAQTAGLRAAAAEAAAARAAEAARRALEERICNACGCGAAGGGAGADRPLRTRRAPASAAVAAPIDLTVPAAAAAAAVAAAAAPCVPSPAAWCGFGAEEGRGGQRHEEEEAGGEGGEEAAALAAALEMSLQPQREVGEAAEEAGAVPPLLRLPEEAPFERGTREFRVQVAVRSLALGGLGVGDGLTASVEDGDGDEDKAAAAMDTLVSMLQTVLMNPGVARVRRVRLSNRRFHRVVGSHPAAVAVLSAVGFDPGTDGGDELVLGRDDPGLLWVAKDLLEQYRAVF